MVDSIHGGPGQTVIITTKPKPKPKVKDSGKAESSSFKEALGGKTGAAGTSKSSYTGMMNNVAQNNLRIIQNQQLMHMQKVQEIARQIAAGTYKMCSPEALAEKLLAVAFDKNVRERFVKKLLKEEKEKLAEKYGKVKDPMTDLEFKKLVYLIKESQDGKFDDPELDAMIKELS